LKATKKLGSATKFQQTGSGLRTPGATHQQKSKICDSGLTRQQQLLRPLSASQKTCYVRGPRAYVQYVTGRYRCVVERLVRNDGCVNGNTPSALGRARSQVHRVGTLVQNGLCRVEGGFIASRFKTVQTRCATAQHSRGQQRLTAARTFGAVARCRCLECWIECRADFLSSPCFSRSCDVRCRHPPAPAPAHAPTAHLRRRSQCPIF
jgi:hypothetical protein